MEEATSNHSEIEVTEDVQIPEQVVEILSEYTAKKAAESPVQGSVSFKCDQCDRTLLKNTGKIISRILSQHYL